MNKLVVYEEALARAMERLSHLTLIIPGKRVDINHNRSNLEAGLSEDVTPDPAVSSQSGAAQLSLFFSAADKAGLRITKFVSGSLGQCPQNYCIGRDDTMIRSIRNLRSLHLLLSFSHYAFDVDVEYDPFSIDSDPSEWSGFATSAPCLENLSIRYNKSRPSTLLI